jgi:hypothetical protein
MKRLTVLLVVAACNNAPGDPPAGADGGTSDASSGGSSSPSAPKILSLNTNVTMVTPTDRLIVSAVVTDPDGIDDLIGGNLTTISGSAAYGAFATSAGEGAYSISLSWSDLDAAAPIDTAYAATTSRVLRASFFDVAGHTVYRDVTVALGCSGMQAACDGTCSPVNSIDSCGSCGHACPLPSSARCSTTSPVPLCYVTVHSETPVSCATMCVAPYSKCVEAGAAYENGAGVLVSCSGQPAATHNGEAFSWMYCACGEP